MSRASAALYKQIKGSYEDIDNGIRMAEVVESLDAAFEFKY